MCAKSLSPVWLCDPMDYSPQGSSVYGISQERILEWVAISLSRGSSNPGIIPASPTLAGVFFTTELPGKTPEKLLFNHWVMSNSLWPHGLGPAKFLCPWNSPSKNTGVGHFSSVQSLSCVWLFARPGLQHARPPCPSSTPRVYPNSRPLSQWCHPTISSSIVPLSSCLQSFPASGSLQMTQLLTSHGQILEFQLQHQSFQWTPWTDLL